MAQAPPSLVGLSDGEDGLSGQLSVLGVAQIDHHAEQDVLGVGEVGVVVDAVLHQVQFRNNPLFLLPGGLWGGRTR